MKRGTEYSLGAVLAFFYFIVISYGLKLSATAANEAFVKLPDGADIIMNLHFLYFNLLRTVLIIL
jgi:hypothetical protein